MPAETSDKTPLSLLERIKQPGANEAWERFVRLYTPLLYHWARRLGLDQEDASDLVQDVFALLVRKLPEFSYDPEKRFRGWLWTVLLNSLRERRRRPGLPVADEAGSALDRCEGPDEIASIDEEEYRQYLIQRALQLMQNEFQPTTWKAFWEYVANDRPAAEVADELGVTAGAVYAAKVRVLSRLREELRGLLP